MRIRTSLLVITAAAASVALAAKYPMVGGQQMFPTKTIVENAVNSADHTTLVAAVKAAGLVDTLQGPGPFTVFAPTNAAFAKLPAGSLANAALVGAKTVNGPGPCSVSTSPAALTAATSVVWSAELTAFSTIVLVGNICCPPTIGYFAASATDAAAAVITSKEVRIRIGVPFNGKNSRVRRQNAGGAGGAAF